MEPHFLWTFWISLAERREFHMKIIPKYYMMSKKWEKAVTNNNILEDILVRIDS